MGIRRSHAIAVGLVLVAVAVGARAHGAHGQTDGLWAGSAHPIGGLDHVLAMVAVGLWGAVLGGRAVWLLPLAFPASMAVGGALGMQGVGVPAVELGIALSSLALGMAVLTRWQPPVWAAAALVAAFALFHGHAHGAELPEGARALAYGLGFLASTTLLHLTGIGLGASLQRAGGQAWLRGAGASVAIGGMLFVWRALA